MPQGFFYGDLPPTLQTSYENDPRNAIAQQLLKGGTSQTPLRGGATEGILRLANALLGGYSQRKLGQEYQQKGTDYNSTLAAALAGIKPGSFDPNTRTYTPSDSSGAVSILSGNPSTADLARTLQLQQIGTGLKTDQAATEAQIKEAYRTPEITNVNGRIFKDGVDTGQTVPKQYDPEAAALRNLTLQNTIANQQFQRDLHNQQFKLEQDKFEADKKEKEKKASAYPASAKATATARFQAGNALMEQLDQLEAASNSLPDYAAGPVLGNTPSVFSKDAQNFDSAINQAKVHMIQASPLGKALLLTSQLEANTIPHRNEPKAQRQKKIDNLRQYAKRAVLNSSQVLNDEPLSGLTPEQSQQYAADLGFAPQGAPPDSATPELRRSQAAAAIKANPSARAAVLQALSKMGVDPSGL